MNADDAMGIEILNFHERLMADPHHRFRSWEHCYGYFQRGPNDFDLASLHLAFYLASWGMYRGSSFLLQKDYRVHVPVVAEVLKPQYALLRNPSLDDFTSDKGSQVTGALFELFEWIRQWHASNTSTDRGAANVSDTLATKILLGTLGCTPAYDRYFTAGLRSRGLKFSYFNRTNFSQMIQFCLLHRDAFERAQKAVSAHGVDYPIMKIIDMYFWRLGEVHAPADESAD